MALFKFQSSKRYNQDYNEVVMPVLEEYFSPKKIGHEGYVPVGEYNSGLAKRFTIKAENQVDIYSEHHKFQEKINGFSDYEHILLSNILHGENDTMLISGAMGSGKTSTLNFIFETMVGQENFKDTIIIRLDFSEGYALLDIDKVMHKFLVDLYESLKAHLVMNIGKFNLSDLFIKHIMQNYNEFRSYFDFSFENLMVNPAQWNEQDESSKIFSIFRYIQETGIVIEKRVDMLMKFLGFIVQELKKQNVYAFIFYDNIDHLVPVAQKNIIVKLLSLNEIAKVKKILCVRRSTKSKYDKLAVKNKMLRRRITLLETRAQYVYGHLYHHGPSTDKILLQRTKYLAENIHKIPLFKSLDPQIIEAIANRARMILEYFALPQSMLKKTFYCIGGESNRLSLVIAPRLFCNSVFPFDKRPLNHQTFVRAFYNHISSDYNDGFMSPSDMYTANVISNGNYGFSLINWILFRIIELNYIEESSRYTDFSTASTIYDILFEQFEYSDEQIIDAFNYMMSDKRALIGGEYKPGYQDSDELTRIDDRLRITELGDRYFNMLLLDGNIYVQNCILSLHWGTSTNYTSILKDSIMERFRVIKTCLKEMKDEEIYRFTHYAYNAKQLAFKPFNFPSLINQIAIRLCNVFLGITENHPNSHLLEQELQEWYDLFLFWQIKDEELRKNEDFLNWSVESIKLNEITLKLQEKIESFP